MKKIKQTSPTSEQNKTEETPVAETPIRAFTIVQDGRNGWRFKEFLIQGDKVVKTQTSEPTFRDHAKEQFKIRVAKTLFA